MKENVLNMKNDISALALEQRIIKSNRKTVNFKGNRKYDPWVAAMNATANKWELRHMYLAYGAIRGRDLKEIERSCKEPYDENYVNKIVEKYNEIVRVNS